MCALDLLRLEPPYGVISNGKMVLVDASGSGVQGDNATGLKQGVSLRKDRSGSSPQDRG